MVTDRFEHTRQVAARASADLVALADVFTRLGRPRANVERLHEARAIIDDVLEHHLHVTPYK